MKLKSALLAVALAGAATAAHATDAITLGTGYTNFTNGPWTLGFEFSPVSNISVTSLGDYFPAGAAATGSVGLWTASGTLLASASVSTPGAVADGYVFTAITPVALTAGQDYIVGGTTNGADYAVYYSKGFGVAAGINYIVHIESSGNSLTFPQDKYTSFDDFGGNFQFGGVPETSTWVMMLAGFAGLGFLGYRRNKAATLAA
jgi:hypothetical protein